MTEVNTLPARADNKQVTLRQRIDAMAPEFRKTLPAHIPAEKFVRTVQTAVQMNPEITRACNTRDGIQSFFAACTNAAKDGLILDGREAALVTFRSKVGDNRYEDRVQYIPMVAGLMKKARNSGEIASIAAHVVYSNDKFAYVLGDDERIEHEPCLASDRGEPIAVYAIVRLKDGAVQREVMSKSDVMKIAKQSRNAKQYDPASLNFGEWWRKTVIRRISKYLPSSSDRDEFQQAVERIDDGFDFEATDGGETVPVQQATRKRRGGAAAVLKNVTPEPAEPEPEPAEKHDPETGEIVEYEDVQQEDDDI